MNDEQLASRVEKVEAAGKAKYGDAWPQMLDALGKRGGVDQAVLRNVLSQSNAVDLLGTAGKEALIAASDDGDHDAERVYAGIRAAERKAHRQARGRS